MDPSASVGLIYGIIALIVAGGLLFMSRPKTPSVPTVTPPVDSKSYSTILSSFQRWGRIAGIVIPFVIIGIGPLMDLYYNSFHYTTISIVGIASMLVGFLYQAIVRGTTAYLSTLTVGTSATITYVLIDILVQGEGYNFKVLSAIVSAVLLFLQLVHTSSGPVFSSSLLNDGVGLLLGSGLGAIAWTVVYNTYRDYLPITPKPTKPTK